MNSEKPWIVLVPSAGMSHIFLFIRFATTLMEHGFNVVFVTTKSTVSAAESRHVSAFLSSYPNIKSLWYDPLPVNLDASLHRTNDPFYLQYEALSRSKDVLHPLLSKLAADIPISAFISDIFLISCMCDVAESLSMPHYILWSSSATMLAFSLCFSCSESNGDHGEVEIPGVGTFPSFCIPPALRIPEHLFTTMFLKNIGALKRADGVLVNSFYKLEEEAIQALNSGKVVPMPRVFPVGPLVGQLPRGGEDGAHVSKWLDERPMRSVLYVNFGSRHALPPEQVAELAVGLEMAGCNFLWVLKTKVVDKEESQEDVQNVLPDGFVERVKPRGLVVQSWVDQDNVLGHFAVGGFLGHCGWGSVAEAVWHGVPIFAWPQFGDQFFNATVVERNGLGVWKRNFRGTNGGRLIKGEEIGKLLKLWMEDKHGKERSEHLREEARTSVGAEGNSHRTLLELLDRWKKVA